jgi:hypothetical protein
MATIQKPKAQGAAPPSGGPMTFETTVAAMVVAGVLVSLIMKAIASDRRRR